MYAGLSAIHPNQQRVIVEPDNRGAVGVVRGDEADAAMAHTKRLPSVVVDDDPSMKTMRHHGRSHTIHQRRLPRILGHSGEDWSAECRVSVWVLLHVVNGHKQRSISTGREAPGARTVVGEDALVVRHEMEDLVPHALVLKALHPAVLDEPLHRRGEVADPRIAAGSDEGGVPLPGGTR